MVTSRPPKSDRPSTHKHDLQSGRLSAGERRALIEDAAARLFAERGYSSTTVQDIVSAAGVSKPMLYRHFESKKDLQKKLLARRRDELAAAPLDEFLRASHSPAEQRLLAMIDAWFAHVECHPHTSRNLFQDAVGDPEIEALQRELRAQQRAADVALLREFAPQLPETELEPLGEIMRSALTGLALWWLDHPDVPRSVVVAAVLRTTQGVLLTAV